MSTDPNAVPNILLKPYSVQVAEIEAMSVPRDVKEAALKRLEAAITDRSGLTPEQKIRLAQDKVFRLHPIALAAVAARWKIEYDTVAKVDTMATDGKRLVVNRDWTSKLTLGMTSCIVLHEICHVSLGHHFRMGKLPARDRDLANVAADLAINSRLLPEYLRLASETEVAYLLDHGRFPRYGKYSHLPEGKSFEWYFAELKKERELELQQQQQQGGQQPRGYAPSFDEIDDSEPGETKEIPDNLDEIIDEIIEQAEKIREAREAMGERGSGGKGEDGEDGEANTGSGEGEGPGEGEVKTETRAGTAARVDRAPGASQIISSARSNPTLRPVSPPADTNHRYRAGLTPRSPGKERWIFRSTLWAPRARENAACSPTMHTEITHSKADHP